MLFPLPGEREEKGVLEQLVSQPSEKAHDQFFFFAMFKQGKGLKRNIPAYVLQLSAYLPQPYPAIPS